MKINEKLTKPITEVNYLRAENVDRYRVIIRYFYEQYEKIQYWLYKEDVFDAMIQTGLFPNYTIDQCQSDLSSLTEWKNLIAIQDTSKVTSIEEFKNRKYRYQLSEYTIEIERMTLKLENLQVEGASLEPTLLERIQYQIMCIETLQDASMEEIHTWWKDLNTNFIRLNQNYQDYIRTLNNAKAAVILNDSEKTHIFNIQRLANCNENIEIDGVKIAFSNTGAEYYGGCGYVTAISDKEYLVFATRGNSTFTFNGKTIKSVEQGLYVDNQWKCEKELSVSNGRVAISNELANKGCIFKIEVS